MSCAAISTGGQFVPTVLGYIDCQAQQIGTFGYGALASAQSPAASLLIALLTLFVALYALRLMFGQEGGFGELVNDAIKLGIVLTLATSWPAWRTLGYDLVMSGPAQVLGPIGSATGLSASSGGLVRRLQHVDEGIVSLTAFGTGRLTGGVTGSSDLGDSNLGVALADQTGFAWGRVAFLAGTIAPLGLVRLAAGVLLAVAPLIAGLLLFGETRDVFAGWLRALLACALGSLFLSLFCAVEAAAIESWLVQVLERRDQNVLVPGAPIELLVLAIAFAAMTWGMLALLGRLVFFGGLRGKLLPSLSDWSLRKDSAAIDVRPGSAARSVAATDGAGRVLRLSNAVNDVVRREAMRGISVGAPPSTDRNAPLTTLAGRGPSSEQRLGSVLRRTRRRSSLSAGRRDERRTTP